MKKSIAVAFAGALAAGTALGATAANAQSGFSVTVGSPGYYEDYGWGSGWDGGYRPVHSWGGGTVVGAPAYGYYDAPAVTTTTTRVVRRSPAYGYYDEPAVATTRTVVAQRPAYRTSRVVASRKVVYRNPTYRTQRVVTRQVVAQPTIAYGEPTVVTTRRIVRTQSPAYGAAGVYGAAWDDAYGYDAPRVTTTTRRVIGQPTWC
jgi:hypothetical protein